MSETVKKSGYAKPQLKTYGGVQQLTLVTKTTESPSDGAFLTFQGQTIPVGSLVK